MPYYAGVDIGSLSTDTVVMNQEGRILAWDVTRTGGNSLAAGEKSLTWTLERAGLSHGDLAACVATGYGRVNAPYARKAVTEITCHGRGAFHLFPGTRMVIDIGGQDSKVIRLDSSGAVIDFAMNDKCAAGTGRFLEVMAKALEIDLTEMGPLSLRAEKAEPVSSTCTVFAESEVVSLVAAGRPLADIINGIHQSIAQRVASMALRMGLASDVTMTGGVAKNTGLVARLRQILGTNINLPEEPQIVGALGAALIAREM